MFLLMGSPLEYTLLHPISLKTPNPDSMFPTKSELLDFFSFSFKCSLYLLIYVQQYEHFRKASNIKSYTWKDDDYETFLYRSKTRQKLVVWNKIYDIIMAFHKLSSRYIFNPILKVFNPSIRFMLFPPKIINSRG